MIHGDTELAGFGLRVTGASKTYIVEKHVNGRKVSSRIGRHNQIPTEKARKIAQSLCQAGMMSMQLKEPLTLNPYHTEIVTKADFNYFFIKRVVSFLGAPKA